jgi:hypothetical protein
MDDARDAAPTPQPPAPQETDALFKAQMALSDVVLGYWKQAFAALGVLLLGVLAWSVFDSVRTARVEDAYARIGAIDYLMPPAMEDTPFGPRPANDADHLEDLKIGAGKYAEVAASTSGAPALEAWLKASDAWRRAGDDAQARKALETANALQLPGILGFTASFAHAQALADGGDAAGAMAALRALAGTAGSQPHGANETEAALMALAQLQIASGKPEDARTTLQELAARIPSSSRTPEREALAKTLAPAAPASTGNAPAPTEPPASAPPASGPGSEG